MPTISASEARQSLPAQLTRVEQGEEIEITRHGRVVAVLVRPDVLAARRASPVWAEADRLGELLEAARAKPLPPASIGHARADELVRDVRDARDGR